MDFQKSGFCSFDWLQGCLQKLWLLLMHCTGRDWWTDGWNVKGKTNTNSNVLGKHVHSKDSFTAPWCCLWKTMVLQWRAGCQSSISDSRTETFLFLYLSFSEQVHPVDCIQFKKSKKTTKTDRKKRFWILNFCHQSFHPFS